MASYIPASITGSMAGDCDRPSMEPAHKKKKVWSNLNMKRWMGTPQTPCFALCNIVWTRLILAKAISHLLMCFGSRNSPAGSKILSLYLSSLIRWICSNLPGWHPIFSVSTVFIIVLKKTKKRDNLAEQRTILAHSRHVTNKAYEYWV